LARALGSSTTLVFDWNTTGFDYGNYSIRAVADKPTIDDSGSGCFAVVTIPGDIDGNFQVQLADLVTLAKAYGSQAGDTNWNSNADIDGNLVVGLSDLVVLAQHYGQHYP
jgi:hypothetical protein